MQPITVSVSLPSTISVDLTVIGSPINVAVSIPQVSGPSSGGSGNEMAEVVTRESFTAYQVVTGDGYVAGSNKPSTRAKAIGIATADVSSAQAAAVQVEGAISNPSWNWVGSTPVFLYTDGTLSQTPPSTGYIQVIGYPTDSTTIVIEIDTPILL